MAFLQTTTDPILPLFYNVDANVGRGCPNKPEDVALVSFLLVKWMQAEPKAVAEKKLAAEVTIGVYNAKLQALIDKIQSDSPGTTKDGRVSRAHAGCTYSSSSGSGPFLICRANAMVGKANDSVWPRLDKIADCPPSLVLLVKRVVLPGF